MNKTFENRDIEQDDLIEYLKPKKFISSDELLECPCAKNNIKPRTNYDKITSSVESLANMLIQMSLNCDFIPCYYAPDGKVFAMDKEGAIQYTIEWLQKECEDDTTTNI